MLLDIFTGYYIAYTEGLTDLSVCNLFAPEMFFSQNTTLWKKAKSYNECNCSLE